MTRPSLSTATGDDGTTGLIGGSRVSKSDERIWSFGEVDELNSIIGLVLAEGDLPLSLRDQLPQVQRTLFEVGTDLAAPANIIVDRISSEHVATLERWGVALEAGLPPLTRFVLPGGSKAACFLHQARTVCRRAERCIIALAQKSEINPQLRVYINRLADYLFLAARTANMHAGAPETEWIPPTKQARSN
jgi:cob(I)alamin adenosyltransferase